MNELNLAEVPSGSRTIFEKLETIFDENPSNVKVQLQINTRPQINHGGVYLKFDRVDPAFFLSPLFIRGPAFNR